MTTGRGCPGLRRRLLGGPVCQVPPSARVAGRPLAGPPPSGRQRGWPSVPFAGFYAIPRSPGDRRAPQAESRGPGSGWRPSAPSARVAERPLAGPPPSGRQRLVQSRGPGSVWRPGAPSARVAERPLAGPPPSGRQRGWPSVRFAGVPAIPRLPGDRRAPQAESRGSGSVWRPGAPSARVAERPLAGPPPSGRPRLYGRPRLRRRPPDGPQPRSPIERRTTRIVS